MPVKTKRATAAPAKAARPTIAGLQAEIIGRDLCIDAVKAEIKRLTAQRDASWAALGRLWEATGGEQGDRRAETREELLGWAVDDAITLIERGREAVESAVMERDQLRRQRDAAIKDRDERGAATRDALELAMGFRDRIAQHERERAACWGCRISAYWRSLRG